MAIAKQRAGVFSSWKNRENAWEQIKSWADKMSLVKLHWQVKNKDLFPVEAKHHPSCFKSFHTDFTNYEHRIRRADIGKDTEHAVMSATNDNVLVLVLEHIQTHVVQQNKVLQPSSLRLIYVKELKRNGYENSNYRSEKLLKCIQNDTINNYVNFTKVDHGKSDVI